MDHPASDAKLIIQSPAKKELILTEENPGSNTAPTAIAAKPEQAVPKIGKLQNIRDKFANKSSDNALSIVPLTTEKLQDAWKAFTEQLKEKKNPAAQSFDLAALNIIDEGRFEVITNNNLEQRFIEQEKRKLCEYLQTLFVNKSLTLEIKIKENPEVYKPDEKHLSKRDQYQKIIEQYPLVKELKDRLRMELDY
jgi:DNA polymerase-3 subunit gamma/tau